MTTLNRRDFLKIALGTVSAAALSGPLALVWPEEARSRPVAEPWLIDLEDGYLVDNAWADDDWPTYREHWDYDWLSIDEKVKQLLTYAGYGDERELFINFEQISKPRSGWHQRALARIEKEIGGILDEPIDPDLMTFDDLMRHGPHVPGTYVLDHLPPEEQERLGLKLVEGLSPGNDNFCGVRFKGDVDELNEALARHGINVVVRREGA